jgi:DNA-binding CsgD family transcriptional regulator
MVTAQPSPGTSGSRVRIAISSPEILAHIRREFAGRGLTVRIDGLPAVDVLVTVGPATAPQAGVLGDTLNRLAGPDSYRRDPATARYRLVLIPHDQAIRPAVDGRTTAHPPNGAGGPGRADSRPLTPREVEVMESISRGLRNADIAASLQVGHKTVKNHVNRIFAKLGARSRVEAVLIWQGGTTTADD